MTRWPNFFIAGAPRCGTSTLHAWLPSLPGVFMSRIKEPNYFSRRVIGDDFPLDKPIRDDRRYLRLFKDAGHAAIVGEATPFYLCDPGAPAHIRRKSPDARVLASLRDPVERLYSHYLMMRNNVPGFGSFREEIERGLSLRGLRNIAYLDPTIGLYSRQVARYRHEFGVRFKVILFEDWTRDTPKTLRSISEFLGLGPVIGPVPAPRRRRYAEARGPLVRFVFGNRYLSRASEALMPDRLRTSIRKAALVKETPRPPMDPRARSLLIDYYQEDMELTQRILGRRLPWRNFRGPEPTLLAG
jgi:hypothetical protein